MKEQLKQPSSLKTFFATELWERYGFYVTQSLLALFLAIQHHWPDDMIYQLVGTFTALTYFSPIVGGWVADHWIGQKKSVILGATFLFASYILLSLSNADNLFLISLSSIAIGTGLLKPNVSSLIGNQYTDDNPNRTKGFTIFYMGITLGIIMGTTIPSILVAKFGWKITFLSAALGMVISLASFTIGIKYYHIHDYFNSNIKFVNILYAILTILILGIAGFYLLSHPSWADNAFFIVCSASVTYLIHCIYQETGIQRTKTTIILCLCFISVLFWAFYFQMFLALTLFLSRVVQPNIMGIQFPPPYFVAVQSIGMLFFGAIITALPSRALDDNILIPLKKFFFSMLITLFAYIWIIISIKSHLDYKLIPALFFIPTYLLISIAELLLSPVGLSAMTELAHKHKVSTMMGIFFVSLGLGAFLAGKLAFITAIDVSSITDIIIIKNHYLQGFKILAKILAGCTIISGGIYFCFRNRLKK